MVWILGTNSTGIFRRLSSDGVFSPVSCHRLNARIRDSKTGKFGVGLYTSNSLLIPVPSNKNLSGGCEEASSAADYLRGNFDVLHRKDILAQYSGIPDPVLQLCYCSRNLGGQPSVRRDFCDPFCHFLRALMAEPPRVSCMCVDAARSLRATSVVRYSPALCVANIAVRLMNPVPSLR